MANKIYILIKVTYLNRFRKLSYADESRFYILLLVFAIGYYLLWTKNFDYKSILINIFLFSNTITLLQRNDYKFLKKHIGTFFSNIFISIDIFVWNALLLFYLLANDIQWFFIHILLIIISPFILKVRKKNISTIKIFSIKDPIWNIHLRTKPWEYLILFFSLFLQYQGIQHQNKGLYTVGLYTINLLFLQIYSVNETLYFYKFSNYKPSLNLVNLYVRNIINFAILFIPSLIMPIILYQLDYIEISLTVLFCITPIFWLRYIFFKDNLLKIIFFYALIFTLYNLNNNYYNIILIPLINLVLYHLTKEKFTKLIIN